MKNKYKNYSISDKLREEKKSNEYFEMLLCNLNLEDLIALRLELAFKNTGTLYYNFPIWKNFDFIIKDSLLKYAVSVNSSKSSAARFLGINIKEFNIYCKKFNIDKYFNEEKN